MRSEFGLAGLIAALVLATAAPSAPLVIGHRGTGVDKDSNPFPENTVPALIQGFAEGADLIEIDVQLAADGTPVIWHDEKVDVGGESKRVGELLPDEFPLLTGPTGLTAPVPTFREALRTALEHGAGTRVLDIEIKVYRDSERAALVAAVAQVIREERAARRVLISSFDLEALKLAEAELPGVESGLLGVFSGSTLSKVKKANAAGAEIEWVIPGDWLASAEAASLSAEEVRVRSASFARKAHEAGVRVGIWTVNKESDLRSYAEDGYDALITDEPDVGRRVVDGQDVGLAE